MTLTRYAVRRRLATSAIVVALVVLGLYGLWRLPLDYLPNITYYINPEVKPPPDRNPIGGHPSKRNANHSQASL